MMTQNNIKNVHLYTNKELESITPLRNEKIPKVMTVAGSDSSGGAGIEADIKTITAHQCYAMTCIVTLTAQNTKGVTNVAKTTGEMVTSIFDENFSDIEIDSIKTGLLSDESIPALKNTIEKYNYKGILVVDPVMVSTSGYDFVSNKFLNLLIDTLAPYITLITPNLIEAKALVNTLSKKVQYDNNPLVHLEEMYAMCKKVHDLTGIKNILVKGGHQSWGYDKNLLTDVLYISQTDTYICFYSKMQISHNTHGTGCTLSSAIASNLASGLSMVNSIANGIVYVQKGIETAPSIGHGHGPLNHLQSFQQFNYESLINEEFELPFMKGDALEYLYDHTEIQNLWKEYTNHKFMKQVKNYQLSFDKFIDFVEQNIVYLVNYTRVILFMATKINNEEKFIVEADRLKTLSKEISKYKTMLKKIGYDDFKINSIKPNKVCQKYIDLLLSIAKDSGDYFDISISLTPCFYGYYIACLNATGKGQCDDLLKCELYDEWINQHISDWYKDACIEAEKGLNETFEKYCHSQTKLDRAIQIFKMFTSLEIEFLNYFL